MIHDLLQTYIFKIPQVYFIELNNFVFSNNSSVLYSGTNFGSLSKENAHK